MVCSKRFFLAIVFLAATSTVAFAESDAEIIRRAEVAVQNALKDPKKVRLIECLGVNPYAVRPSNWKAPTEEECDELQRSMGLSPMKLPPDTVASNVGNSLNIQQGALKFSRSGRYAEQPVAVINSGTNIVHSVEIECGFFRGEELLAAERSRAYEVEAGQTAYISILSLSAPGATNSKCRIVR